MSSQRKAQVIGVDHYVSDVYHALRGAIRDAQEVSGFLKYRLPEKYRFEVDFLADPTAIQVETALCRIQEALTSDSALGSTFFLYFAGHGVRYGKTNKQLLLCADAAPSVLAGSSNNGGITPEVLSEFMRTVPADMVFCYDVCRTAVTGRGPDTGGTTSFRDIVLQAPPQSTKSARSLLSRRR